MTTPVVKIEIEETLGNFELSKNGSYPFWCYGAPLVVRRGDDVFISTTEAGKDIPPLCNTRWQIRRRTSNGWKIEAQAEGYRQREPSPLLRFADGTLLLSCNPSTQPVGTQYGPCQPQLLIFDKGNLAAQPKVDLPELEIDGRYTDHSYRGIAVDANAGEVLLLNIDQGRKDEPQCWSFRDRDGHWKRHGRLVFENRGTYPAVALKARAAHAFLVGALLDPDKRFMEVKTRRTGTARQYVWRWLYYVWSPDISKEDFHAPIEIDNAADTCGVTWNRDIWIGPDGAARLLYSKHTFDFDFMQEELFPKTPQRTSLHLAVVKNGKLTQRELIVEGGEGIDGPVPDDATTAARLHATPDGRLFVLYVTHAAADKEKRQMWLQQLEPTLGKPVPVPLQDPQPVFFTNCERGGSEKSFTVDLFGGTYAGGVYHYSRLAIQP